MDTLRRSRNPATVVTANGEVQTNEEAQVYVHDLDLFVTVSLLDETPTVLSLGKLCSENGYEWKKRWNYTTDQKWDNFVPLVVPGSSSFSSSSSASTLRPKDQSNSSGESEATSGPVTTRRAKRACGKPMQTNPDMHASGNRDTDKEDPTQGIPDWLQPFSANLEDLETHVPARSSEREILDSEGDASKSGDRKTEAQYLYSLHQRPKLRHMLKNWNYGDSVQKTR